MNHDDIVIVAAARTPQGRLKGQLAPLTAVQLGSAAIRGALDKGGIPADRVLNAMPPADITRYLRQRRRSFARTAWRDGRAGPGHSPATARSATSIRARANGDGGKMP